MASERLFDEGGNNLTDDVERAALAQIRK